MNGLLMTTLILALSAPNPMHTESLSAVDDISLICTASWYSEDDAGILKTTANMETFDDEALTCAMWHVPFDTMLKVTNLDNGKSVVVRVNDRGPAKRLVKEGRMVDLTKKAFSEIAPLKKGLIQVKVTIKTPFSNCEKPQGRYNANQSQRLGSLLQIRRLAMTAV